MRILTIDRMPTSKELRYIGMSWLCSLIGRNEGLLWWADKLQLETKRMYSGIEEKDIPNLINTAMNELETDKMPSRTEILKVFGNNALHNKIVRSGGYREWADTLNLELKESETKTGQDFEEMSLILLRNEGFKVEKMSTKHPFDILINDTVKVDVKSGRPYLLNGSRCHSFGINKKHGSCDVYVILALDEGDNIERNFIIPSHHLKITTLSIGEKSSYNKYLNRFDLINKYNNFHKSITI